MIIEEYNGYLRLAPEDLAVARESDPHFPAELGKEAVGVWGGTGGLLEQR